RRGSPAARAPPSPRAPPAPRGRAAETGGGAPAPAQARGKSHWPLATFPVANGPSPVPSQQPLLPEELERRLEVAQPLEVDGRAEGDGAVEREEALRQRRAGHDGVLVHLLGGERLRLRREEEGEEAAGGVAVGGRVEEAGARHEGEVARVALGEVVHGHGRRTGRRGGVPAG